MNTHCCSRLYVFFVDVYDGRMATVEADDSDNSLQRGDAKPSYSEMVGEENKIIECH